MLLRFKSLVLVLVYILLLDIHKESTNGLRTDIASFAESFISLFFSIFFNECEKVK